MLLIDLPIALLGAMFFSGWVTTVISAIFVIALILEVSNDRYMMGYGSLFVYAIALTLFTDIKPFVYIWHNPVEAIGFVIGYFIVGALYSVLKYRDWLKGVTLNIRECKLAFIKLHDLSIEVTQELPTEAQSNWKSYLYSYLPSDDYYRIKSGFGPGSQKELILNWIAFWPFSAVGLLIANPLECFVNWLYEEFVGIYRNMYAKIIGKYINISDIQNLK